MLPSRKKTKHYKLNNGDLYRNTLQTSRFIKVLQTNRITCLLITADFKAHIMVESRWLSQCVGCWYCFCTVTKPIKRANQGSCWCTYCYWPEPHRAAGYTLWNAVVTLAPTPTEGANCDKHTNIHTETPTIALTYFRQTQQVLQLHITTVYILYENVL